MAKVLITGGAGYVGSVVTGAFLDAGHAVTVFDSLAAGGQGLLVHVPNRRLCFIKGDVRDPRAMKLVAKGQDAVIHLAAIVGFHACNADPQRAESINVDGTRVVLDACDRGQCLLYASTGSVYGAVPDGLCDETIEPAPLSGYGRTKLAAEKIVLSKGDALVLRFATAFGMSTHMRLDLLVNQFVYSAKSHGFIVIYNKDALRTFIHVRDMARALLFGLERFSSMAGHVYNAGSEHLNRTKDEIAQLVNARHPCFLTYGPIGADEDQRDYAVSYKKLRSLGFETQVTMDEGIDELLRGMDLVEHRGPFGAM